MKLLIFAASHRPDSYNRILAKLAQSHAQSKHIDVDFAEYAEFDMPLYNAGTAPTPEAAKSFARRAEKVDGIVICSPEYNWSYPGTLKNIIDWTSRIKPSPLKAKTALLMSATPGARGGILGLSHLKTPLEAIGIFVYPRVFPLGNAETAFTNDGRLANAPQETQLTAILDDYLEFTRKLS